MQHIFWNEKYEESQGGGSWWRGVQNTTLLLNNRFLSCELNFQITKYGSLTVCLLIKQIQSIMTSCF